VSLNHLGPKIPGQVSVYLKPKMKASPEVELFGRVGLAKAKAKISVEGDSVSGSESGFSYGVGLSYAVNKDVKLSVDYMSIVDKSSVKATGFTLGLGFAF
jgi:opacity protein-like surface antigen